MLPSPSLKAFFSGLAYAFAVATNQVKAGDPNAHPQDVNAIWQVLWAHWLLSLAASVLMAGHVTFYAFIAGAVISLTVTMVYPVVSYQVLIWLKMSRNYPQFIIIMMWLNCLQMMIVLMFHLLALVGLTGARNLLPFLVLWLLWVFWRGATQSLNGRGWIGALMLVIKMIVEIFVAITLLIMIAGDISA